MAVTQRPPPPPVLDGTPERYAGHPLARKPLVPTLMMMGLQRRTFGTNPCLASQPSYASCSPSPHSPTPSGRPFPKAPPARRTAPHFESGVGADELVVAEEATSARQCTLYAGAVESICSKPLEIKQRISLLAACDTCLQCSVAPSRQISAESPTALPTSWAAAVDCKSVKTATATQKLLPESFLSAVKLWAAAQKVLIKGFLAVVADWHAAVIFSSSGTARGLHLQ
jgi:hypothetical protein